MSKESFDCIKTGKPFRLGDLFIYGGILLIILAVFLAVLLPKKNNSDGFVVYLEDSVVLTYEYDGDKLSVESAFVDRVTISNDEITVYLDESKTEFNTFKIDKNGKSVKMTEANCSIKKDCVHSPALSGGTGAIVCMPHQLKIVPLGDGYIPPTTG